MTAQHLVALVIFVVSMLLWAFAIVAPPTIWGRYASLPAWVAVLALSFLVNVL